MSMDSNTSSNSTDSSGNDSIPIPTLVLIAILACIIMLTMIGNGLVCVSVARFQHLQFITNYFIVSLAVADFLVGAIVLPFSISVIVRANWTYGVWWCNVWISLDVTLCTSSVWHLFIIALERALAIMKPLWYQSKMTIRTAVILITAVWVISAVISILPIMMGWNTKSGNIQNMDQPNQCRFHTTPFYSFVVGIIAFWIPMIGMLVLHTSVTRIARKQAMQIKKLHNTLQNPTEKKSPFSKSERKAAMALAIIMCCFLVCWGPYIIYWTLAGVSQWHISSTALDVITWLGYINSTLNPFIYAFFNTEFRRAFKIMIIPGRTRRNSIRNKHRAAYQL
ncbi:octopamine receptor beta-1R-like [Saccoglossus kowalevskii]